MKNIWRLLFFCILSTCAFVEGYASNTKTKVPLLNATSDSRIRIVLIGVDNYADRRIPRLFYCGTDMKELRDAFLQLGATARDVVLLSGEREFLDGSFTNENAPTKERIEEVVEELSASADPNDSIFLCLSGHGTLRRVRDANGTEKFESCFCPQDADLDKLDETLVSLPWLYRKMGESKARFKTLVIDACRDEISDVKSSEASNGGFGFASSLTNELSNDVLLLTSCSSGQKSYEDFEFQHGVFAYYLTRGLLRRAPELQQDKTLYFSDFWRYVESKTTERVRQTLLVRQTPTKFLGNLEQYDFPVRSSLVKEQEPTFYENAIGMEFLKIPSGQRSLVSKKATETRTTKLSNPRSFYIGVYEVTEKEWRSILGLGRLKTDEDARCSRFPVANVSWEDVEAFVKRLNETVPPAGDSLLGENWEYDLPTRDEWEYAFAYNLDDTDLNDVYQNFDTFAQAKFDLDAPGRLAYVGLKRPIGQLFDMLGNVSEWCRDDSPVHSNARGTKGGSFNVPKTATREAFSPLHTFYVEKGTREPTIGFRLVIRKKVIANEPVLEMEEEKERDVIREAPSVSTSSPTRLVRLPAWIERSKRNAQQNIKERANLDETIIVNKSRERKLNIYLKSPTEEAISEYDKLTIRSLSEYRIRRSDGLPDRVYLNNGGKIYYYKLNEISELLCEYDDESKKWRIETRR